MPITVPSQILIHFPPDRERAALACRPALGVPLVLRSCLTLIAAGYHHVVIVAPLTLHRHLRCEWDRLVRDDAAQLTLVTLSGTDAIPDDALFTLRGAMAERYVALSALTAMTEAWVREALGPALRHQHPLRGGRLMERATMHTQLPATLAHTDLPDPLQLPRHYVHLRTAADVATYELALSEQIRHGDIGWFAKHLNKRMSLPISRILARWRVSPHLITLVNLLIGVGSGVAAAGDSYTSLLLAGALFQLASILDGCDGEVAKFTFRTSRLGQLVDTVGDTTTLCCFFLGLSVHYYHAHGSGPTMVLVTALFGGVGTLILIMLGYLARHGNSWSLVAFDRLFVRPRMAGRHGGVPALLHYGKSAIKKDCFSWIFFGLALVGMLPWALYLATGATWVGVLGILWISRLSAGEQALTSGVAASSLLLQTAADNRDQIPQHR